MTNSLHPLVAQAHAALDRNDLAAATAAAEERLQAEARDIDALRVRAIVQQREGKLAEAAATLKAVLGLAPRADWAYNDLVELLFALRRLEDAEQLARLALRVNPRNAGAHNLFGTVLSELNDLPGGEWHFRRALELGGANARYATNLGLNLMKQGRTEEADGHFVAADALVPGDARTLGHWSKLYEVRGELERAQEVLQKGDRPGGNVDLSLLRAGQLARCGKIAEALTILESSNQLNGDSHLERGRLYDRVGRYEAAWQDFVVGKQKLAAEAGGLAYHADAVQAFFARLTRFFTRERVALLPRAALRTDVPQPIFIMGAPRSGTTMIEQVLASHSAVRAGGELTYAGDLRKLTNLLLPGAEQFPDNLAHSWTADNHHVATLFRDYYLARAAEAGLLEGDQRFFTDKMPFNEVWLPLVRMAFPHAPVVHVVRHPLDVCVSMLSNNLNHGFYCAYRIETIVQHLAAVAELVAHYEGELTTHRHVLRYETFVSEQGVETRRLLDHVGLPFEDGCLAFHENRRYARTPSYAQVTEKLNERSVERFRHYAPQLAPFAGALQPQMAANGYRF